MLRRRHPTIPMWALTATATLRVRADGIRALPDDTGLEADTRRAHQLGDSLRSAANHGGLLPGIRPRRARRRSPALPAAFRYRRYPCGGIHDSAKGRSAHPQTTTNPVARATTAANRARRKIGARGLGSSSPASRGSRIAASISGRPTSLMFCGALAPSIAASGSARGSPKRLLGTTSFAAAQVRHEPIEPCVQTSEFMLTGHEANGHPGLQGLLDQSLLLFGPVAATALHSKDLRLVH